MLQKQAHKINEMRFQIKTNQQFCKYLEKTLIPINLNDYQNIIFLRLHYINFTKY